MVVMVESIRICPGCSCVVTDAVYLEKEKQIVVCFNCDSLLEIAASTIRLLSLNEIKHICSLRIYKSYVVKRVLEKAIKALSIRKAALN